MIPSAVTERHKKEQTKNYLQWQYVYMLERRGLYLTL